jgi:hypothetical protein
MLLYRLLFSKVHCVVSFLGEFSVLLKGVTAVNRLHIKKCICGLFNDTVSCWECSVQMVVWVMNHEFYRIWKYWLGPSLRYGTRTWLKALKNTMETSFNTGWCCGKDSNWLPLAFQPEIILLDKKIVKPTSYFFIGCYRKFQDHMVLKSLYSITKIPE